ncbi:MAG: hypothetical protein J4473_02710 [Candidatus Aenigmarchaeota archaeon]|nr:hypothetical protein [Candidatus Aenigmarchaeota archaeon]
MKISKLEKIRSYKVVVGVVGQSMIIRIPKDLTEIYALKKGSCVELVPEDLQRIEIRVVGRD